MNQLMRRVTNWIAPRMALALGLMAVGVAALLLVPALLEDETKAPDPYTEAAPAGRCPAAVSPDAVRCEINAVRRAAGLAPIRATRKLRVAARRHSEDMVARRYFSHVSPSGATVRDRVARVGYLRGARSTRVGENIGWGTGTAATPAQIVAAWMRSPPHRRIILTPGFRELGVGIARGVPEGGDGRTYTLNVGRRG
jgi:uncharacterized protein YkwD